VALHTQTEPQYDAILWDGTNQTEVETFIETKWPGTWTWTVYGAEPNPAMEGELYGAVSHSWQASIPAGYWAVFGPFWGGEGPSDLAFFTVSPTVYTNRFTAVP